MELAFIPRVLMNYFGLKDASSYHTNILLSNVLVLLMLMVFYHANETASFLPNFCLFERITGKACPFCGCSRAVGACMHYEMDKAWAYNRAGVLLFVYFLIQIPMRLVMAFRGTELDKPVNNWSKIGGWIVFCFFIINWIYNFICGNLIK